MELVYLHTFREVARWGSFTRAAEELGYAQPTVTAQMQKLEQSYGVPLFERYGRRLRMTQAGEALLPYAREMIRLYGESKDIVNRQASGPLAIGTIDTLAAFFLPPYLQSFREQYPAVDLVLRTASEEVILQQLRDGYLDIGIIFDRRCTDKELVAEVVRQEELVIVMPPEHRLASLPVLTARDLASESLILTEEGCTYRGMLTEVLGEQGITPRIACQFSNPEAIKQCVRCGLGVALLPSMAVKREQAEGLLAGVPFRSDKPSFFIQVVHHKKKWLSPSMQFLVEKLAPGQQREES
ncbi:MULTISPECIES: LysR family transcriptional regulator [Brevibacillus]|uniref:LysR family transcriptional regulator n=1 Tax=Brevibacillus parabrevis TaxID=54914 RepID=A0A4Y3PI98_BREPA|nr:LysR family transcriptional regulator [Brevibacillus parabrevis]MBU8713886.1 LysR family transcriptional regulator [Brevibacillus parabrevis]MED2255445.1 LysR family transcriptional regulator [Brevibacillus parabrevis]RNB94811.1 LysR family transcriptional regulator [Brevibacillus parabrevis]WDV94593.1 LysR family transcriptional regulator [Brevibacillus parabrevis]GEB32515.1 LysR family transcriptional regulator [Brevibacillus parabrevis]